jgi:integrase
LKQPLENEINAILSLKRTHIPVVMTREETSKILSLISGIPQLIAKLLYGSGLRISEAIRLRVKDIDYSLKTLIVRSGKGAKDRVTTFPSSLIPFIQDHLSKVNLLHEKDLADGYGEVYMPYALERKYPNADREWGWQAAGK